MATVSDPTPEAILAARKHAGHTQTEAANLIYAGSYRTWQDWEAGRRPMPKANWELYLLKTGQLDLEAL